MTENVDPLGPNGPMHSPEEIEDADFRAVVAPGNTILLPEGVNRGDVIHHMSRTIPQNEYGLPLYYLRSDFLDLELICHRGYTTHDEIDQAAEMLYYEDGYPTLKAGSPFWTSLPHEPRQNYILFQRYLELDEMEGIRLLDSLAHRENVAIEFLRTCFQEFFWSHRARAYDLFLVAANAKKREVRIRKTEDKHFTAAGGILDAVIQRINDEPELLEKMEAKELFDLMEQMVKIQRLSLGLTGQNASSVDPNLKSPGQSVEVILRQLTKGGGLSEQSADNFQNRLALLMSDEATALQAQELVIRATSAGGQ